MEILSGLIVVLVFMMVLAIAMGWCGERYEVRSKLREEKWPSESIEKEGMALTDRQKEVVAHIESLSLEDRKKYLLGDYTLQPISGFDPANETDKACLVKGYRDGENIFITDVEITS